MQNTIKKEWIDNFVDELVKSAIDDNLPHDWHNKNQSAKLHWIQANEEVIKSHWGGSSWDSAVFQMNKEFRNCYDLVSGIANDLDDPRNTQCVSLLQQFDAEVESAFNSYLTSLINNLMSE